jgi:hypothetical protein
MFLDVYAQISLSGKERAFPVMPGQGMNQVENRVVEWGVQVRSQWSTEEDTHMRPGHHWMCEFGDTDSTQVPVYHFIINKRFHSRFIIQSPE